MLNRQVIDKRFLVVDGQEYDLGLYYSVKTEPDFEAASLRKGIEDVLDLHGEDFIKARLKQLLRVI